MKMGHRLIKEDVHHYVYEEKYTPEYRQEAARLVIDTDRAIVDVARELGVGAALLGRWVKQERQRTGQLPTGKSSAGDLEADERTELARLRKENAELKMDNEFLGKAAALLASKQQK